MADIEKVDKETDNLVNASEATKAAAVAALEENMKNAIDVVKMIRKE